MLFTAAQAEAFSQPDGQCTPEEMKNFECFKSAGYIVEIVPDSQGKFPQIINGNSVFTYKITKINAILKIELVDILVPNNCTPKLEILSSNPYGKLFTNAKGGPVTRFGRGLTLDDVWWWNYSGWGGKQISLTIAGNNAGAEHNAMLFMTDSLLPSQWGKGEILAPGCRPLGLISTAQCINLVEIGDEKLSMSVRRDNNNCIVEEDVIFYKSSNCTGTPITPEWKGPDTNFVYSSGTLGGCPELVEVNKSSPVCVTVTLKSGRKTTVCY